MSFTANHAPIRCFFQEIQDKLSRFKPGEMNVKFRLLGTVIGIADMADDEEALSTVPRRLVKLDDGTALANVIITTKMISTISLQNGSLVECIAAMVQERSVPDHASNEASTPMFSLIAEQVAVINDANAETLRWMELCYDKGKSPRGDDSHWQGFPMSSTTAMDLFRIIEYQCEFETEGTTSKKAQPKGVSAEQLKICFDLTDEQVVGFLDELQVRIRRDEPQYPHTYNLD